MTPRQSNALNKIFNKGRIADANVSVSGDIIVIKFPEGRTDKLRITETGMMLGHWKHI